MSGKAFCSVCSITENSAVLKIVCGMQPINTGFSYSEDERDRVYDEKTVSADMLDFLLTFLDGTACTH